MKVKEGLVYNELNGDIVGFVDIGDLDQLLIQLEQGGEHPKYVLVLIVCGLLFKLSSP